MSILQNVYQIEETNGVSGSALATPITKEFCFEIDSITKKNFIRASILWNFGDPNSIDNEILSNNICEIINHTYTYPGTYKVTTIANINEVLFHLEKTIEIN